MWWLVLVIIVICMLPALFYREDDEGRFLIPLGGIVISLIIFLMVTERTYLRKDIRKGHEVQYREVQYGKVDSIAYYINGELIDYSEINDKK